MTSQQKQSVNKDNAYTYNVTRRLHGVILLWWFPWYFPASFPLFFSKYGHALHGRKQDTWSK